MFVSPKVIKFFGLILLLLFSNPGFSVDWLTPLGGKFSNKPNETTLAGLGRGDVNQAIAILDQPLVDKVVFSGEVMLNGPWGGIVLNYDESTNSFVDFYSSSNDSPYYDHETLYQRKSIGRYPIRWEHGVWQKFSITRLDNKAEIQLDSQKVVVDIPSNRQGNRFGFSTYGETELKWRNLEISQNGADSIAVLSEVKSRVEEPRPSVKPVPVLPTPVTPDPAFSTKGTHNTDNIGILGDWVLDCSNPYESEVIALIEYNKQRRLNRGQAWEDQYLSNIAQYIKLYSPSMYQVEFSIAEDLLNFRYFEREKLLEENKYRYTIASVEGDKYALSFEKSDIGFLKLVKFNLLQKGQMHLAFDWNPTAEKIPEEASALVVCPFVRKGTESNQESNVDELIEKIVRVGKSKEERREFSEIEKYLLKLYSDKGYSQLESRKPMGLYYFDTKIIGFEQINVPIDIKDRFNSLYCANISTSVQSIKFSGDEKKGLKPISGSLLVHELKDGKIIPAQQFRQREWQAYGCSLPFLKNVGNYF